MHVHVDPPLSPSTRVVVVRVEGTAAIGPEAWRPATPPGATAVVAQPFREPPAPDEVVEGCRRANREVVRRLAGVAADVPIVVLYAGPPEAALDLGVRLAGRTVRGWPEGPPADATGPRVVLPDDPARAVEVGARLDPDAGTEVIDADGRVRLVVRREAPRSTGGGWRLALPGVVAAGAGPDALRPLIDEGGAEAAVLAVRGLVRRAPRDAAALAAEAVARWPDDVGLLEARSEAELALGRPHEARAALRRVVALRPDRTPTWRRLARGALHQGDVALAAEDARAGLAADPADPDLLDALADALAELDDPSAAAAIEAALAAAPERWAHAVDRRLRIGDLRGAIDLVGRAVDQDLPAGHALAAHLALWRDDRAPAREAADRALAADPGDALALLVLGALAVLDGAPDADVRLQAAQARLDAADPRLGLDTVLAWRCAAARARGDHEAAERHGRDALIAGRRYALPVHVERLLAVVPPDRRPEDRLDPRAWAHLAERCAPALPPGAFASDHTDALVADLEAALRRFGGNRTATLTTVDGGRLAPFPVRPHPRHAGRLLQLRLRTRPADEVVAAFDALCDRFPDEPIVWTYRGEVELWLGRHDDADRSFRRALAISTTTVWAWIGLGAAHHLRGRPDEALSTWAEGTARIDFEGPSVFAYRGELRRLQGDLDRARTNLDVALRASPRRLSSWLNRALVDAAGGAPATADRLVAHLRSRMPGLVVDAEAAGADPADPVAVLEAALRLLRGNRSSSVVTWLVDDATPLRSQLFPPPGPAESWFPSVRDAPRRNATRHRGRFGG